MVLVIQKVFRLHADECLDKIQEFVDIVVNYGNSIMAADQKQLAGNDQLTVGQHVLARSSVYSGDWCNAVVISAGHRQVFSYDNTC